MGRPRVLVLTPYPLLPADSGGRLYALSCSRFGPTDAELHLLAQANRAERAELEQGGGALRTAYREIFASVHFEDRPPIPGERKYRWRRWAQLADQALNGLPLLDLSYYDPAAVRLARHLVRKHDIDLLEIHHLHAAYYRRFLPEVPAILINHNLESELWPFWPLPPDAPEVDRRVWDFFGEQSRRNAREIEIENRLGFAAKLFISARDMERVPDHLCPKLFLPMAVEPDRRPKPFHRDRCVIVWIGGFFWAPNVEGATWLLDEIWPAVEAGARGPVELHFVGADPPASLRARHDGRRIFVHGRVDDVDAIRREADVLVAPLRAGGGVRIKIIEAINAGLPVVATSKGAEGLDLRHREEILVADDAAGFAAALLELEGSVERRAAVGAAARAACAARHSPGAVAAVKQHAYRIAMRR